jgi:hypothetical protein
MTDAVKRFDEFLKRLTHLRIIGHDITAFYSALVKSLVRSIAHGHLEP